MVAVADAVLNTFVAVVMALLIVLRLSSATYLLDVASYLATSAATT